MLVVVLPNMLTVKAESCFNGFILDSVGDNTTDYELQHA